MNSMITRTVLVAAFLAVGAGCANAADEALYKRFGEHEGVVKIVDDVTARWLADPRIGQTFDNVNIDRFKKLLSEQICELVGGPCKYTGRDMYNSHKGLHLNTAEFNALAEDLQITMEKFDIPFTAQNDLMAMLAPMKRDIVTR